MPGYSAEESRIAVMHDTAKRDSAVAELRGRNPGPPRLRGPERGVAHPERCIEALLDETIQRLAAHPMDNFREQDEPGIAVEKRGTGSHRQAGPGLQASGRGKP